MNEGWPFCAFGHHDTWPPAAALEVAFRSRWRECLCVPHALNVLHGNGAARLLMVRQVRR